MRSFALIGFALAISLYPASAQEAGSCGGTVIVDAECDRAATQATMPSLTNKPSQATSEACEKWASEQNDAALEMWSVQENSTRPREVGLNRLYLYCFGVEPPEIVLFGSSADFNKSYCEEHANFKICEGEH
jgi:hypothetical protein